MSPARERPERDAGWSTSAVEGGSDGRHRVGTQDGGHGRCRPGAQKLREMLIMAGPMTTTNSAGKMQNTIGMSIFTGAFWAFS